MAHAAVSPLPRRVCTAIQSYTEQAAANGQFGYIHSTIEEETRRYAATLILAKEKEIAFVSSTSMGLSIIALGLPWQEGDNVVVANGDFPSNIYPWLNLQQIGVQTKFIPWNKNGVISIEDLDMIITSSTRLVSLSSVNYVTGFKIDIDSIGQYLHQRGIFFCVDAIQSLGCTSIDTRHVDFLTANSHKWLMGPEGIGILFVKMKHFDMLSPCLVGWKSTKTPEQFLNYNLDFIDSAKRYEPGGPNVVGIVGLHAALDMLLEVGIDRITERLAQLRKTLVRSLKKKGYDVIGSAEGKQTSGITSFTTKKFNIAEVRQNLDSQGFIVSLRDSLDGNTYIRIAPHFYNTDDEIQAFLAKLPDCHK